MSLKQTFKIGVVGKLSWPFARRLSAALTTRTEYREISDTDRISHWLTVRDKEQYSAEQQIWCSGSSQSQSLLQQTLSTEYKLQLKTWHYAHTRQTQGTSAVRFKSAVRGYTSSFITLRIMRKLSRVQPNQLNCSTHGQLVKSLLG